MKRHNLIGTRDFYKYVLSLAVPIMIQNGITNLVNMLDNIMVGRLGATEMTGIAVSNQLIFVYNLCIFGAISGAGIFGAQFFGNSDNKGVMYSFRFKQIFCISLTILSILLFVFCDDFLIGLYLKGEGSKLQISETLGYAKEYLRIMIIGFIPYTIAQCFSSTLRETGKAVPPMIAGVIAVGTNLILNYILIYGHLGFQKMGVKGAAVATVISRFVELFIVAFWTLSKRQENKFIIGAYKSLYIPKNLVLKIFAKGAPLMLNETMWAAGIAFLNQCYSVRGISVVTANNICQTFFNVFSVSFMAVGMSIGIILGQMLGAGEFEKAKTSSRQLIFFSVLVSVVIGAIFAICAEFIPRFYNIDNDIRFIATRLMQIIAIAMPIDAFAHASYFTLRSGGKAFITFVFDSGFVWAISVPTAFILSRYTSISILTLFAVCQGLNILKCIVGYIFLKKGIWIKNIVKQ